MNWLIENMEVIAFGFVACAVFGAFAALFYQEKKRIDTIVAMAPRMGFTYKKDDNSFRDSRKHLEMFNDGEAHRFTNILDGTRNGVKITMGEYDVRFGSRKGGIHRPKTICVIEDNTLDMPTFALRSQTKMAAKIGAMLGEQDTNFSDDKKFSDAFILQGEVEKDTRDFFDASLRKAFMRFASNEIHMQGGKNTLVVHRGLIIEAQQWPALLKDAFSAYEAIKTNNGESRQ
ncbi:MAG: hypothetical protein CVV41_15730 [Candidatus Riflebacteria bacterium HGW-Riflebacteria-1]|jgi:hypothetical protein|nr:MAG: hypothetical protein CVV41_15730 [Candidatus Riflebacteria bacterium HGW-Riflebacteria-1]